MGRLLLCLALGTVGASIVHIVILLLLPLYTERDAWSQLSVAGPPLQTILVDGKGGIGAIRDDDPLFRSAACRFDLSDGAVHVSARDGAPFWSTSVYNRWGHNIYSFTDRITISRELDLVVGSPAQMIELRQALPDPFQDAILVEVEDPLGIVVVRGFLPDASYAAAVETFLGSVRCTAE